MGPFAPDVIFYRLFLELLLLNTDPGSYKAAQQKDVLFSLQTVVPSSMERFTVTLSVPEEVTD